MRRSPPSRTGSSVPLSSSPALLKRLALLLLALVVGAAVWLACRKTLPEHWPKEVRSRGGSDVLFIADEACAECHSKQYEEWTASHHERAMQAADAATVLGDFDNATLDHFGVTSRFFKKDGRFFVNTEGPDGKLASFEIRYTFGVEPLQQYLVEFPGGRLQCLTTAWDTEAKRWFHLYPEEKIPHDDPLHWTGRYQSWNHMCAECHSTHLRKNYDFTTDTYQTAWAEINVGCQACHGPGEAHVAWARALTGNEEPDPEERGLVVNFSSGEPHLEVDACGRCHSRRHPVSVDDEHGRPFADDFMVATLRDGLYHPDGQILEEVYVHGSFLQSKMHRAGVLCTHCHNPHTAKLVVEGNDLCTRCHAKHPVLQLKSNALPSIRLKDYDSPSHHFHEPGSAGARCVNCHMPEKTYMVVDPRRDHSLRVPRPDLSVKLGTPNACNSCHEGSSAGWAAGVVERWYGPREPSRSDFAEAFARGRAGDPGSASDLIRVAKDGDQAAIVRATALELLGQFAGDGPVAALVAGTRSEDPLVRATAVRGLEILPPGPRLPTVVPFLGDAIRSVRIQAVSTLSSVPPGLFDPEQKEAFEAALREYEDLQMATADHPEAHLNLGLLHANRARPDLAEESYKTAIRMDPSFLPARVNLANLFNHLGRNAEAERIFRETIARFPEEGELYYSLGLLLAERRQLEESVRALARAVELMPERPRVRYNYSLALQHLGHQEEALTAMLAAERMSPEDPSILEALVSFYTNEGRWGEAVTYAEQLARLFPDDTRLRQLLERIRVNSE